MLSDFNENVNQTLKIDVHIDGVPIYKSSGICLWSILIYRHWKTETFESVLRIFN